MSEAGRRRREKAAGIRSAGEDAQRRRERRVQIAGAGTVGLVVVGIIAAAVLARSAEQGPATASGIVAPDPSAPLPRGVLPAGDALAYGVPYGNAAAGLPVLEVWEDFQCPACGAVEAANGAGIARLAEEGKARLVWRPTTFLDRNLGTDASARAVAAWGCAIDAGKTREFHDLVYANQPLREGSGWSDEELVGFGSQAGLAGEDLAAFTGCVADGTYRAWAANSTQEFFDAEIQGTPSALLDGVPIASDMLADDTRLSDAVAKAAGQQGIG